MSSGAQAQIAASQAASAASAEAAANALAFSKEIFGQQRADRAPYIRGGHAGLEGLLALMGLQPGLVHAPGTGGGLQSGPGGGGATLSAFAGGSSGSRSSGGSSGGSSGSYGVPPGGAATNFNVTKPPAGTPLHPKLNPPEMTGARDLPYNRPPYSGIDIATGKPILSVTSGGTPGVPTKTAATAVVTDPSGQSTAVPISLVPFYQARGYSVDG